MTATVIVERESTLAFAWMSWGEESEGGTIYDACIFAVDGVNQFRNGAIDNDWLTYSMPLSPGTHTLEWSYTKDSSVNPTGDFFAIDNVVIRAEGLRGDVNGDGGVDISDATTLINYLLSGNSSGLNLENANCDQQGGVDISDATTLINYLLNGNW